MIGVLIVAGIIFYAVMYSGVQDLKGNPTSILEALTGKGQGASGKAPKTGSPVAGSGGGAITKKM